MSSFNATEYVGLLSDLSTLEPWHVALFWAVHIVGLEVLQHGIVMNMGIFTPKRIPIVGHHLDEFSSLDKAFILFNRICVPFLTYSLLRFTWTHPEHVEWDMDKFTVLNTLGTFMAYFVVYDFFYTIFHRILHIRALYPLVHKHHHRQHAPTRGNLDAVNVHPFEFISGEMLHLVSVALVPGHVLTVVAFLIVGGILASLNHTRYDIRIPIGVYQVRYHDLHHRFGVTVNLGQYITLWDRVFGTFREEDEEKQAYIAKRAGQKASVDDDAKND